MHVFPFFLGLHATGLLARTSDQRNVQNLSIPSNNRQRHIGSFLVGVRSTVYPTQKHLYRSGQGTKKNRVQRTPPFFQMDGSVFCLIIADNRAIDGSLSRQNVLDTLFPQE